MTEFAEALAGLKGRFLARSAEDLDQLRLWAAGGAAPDPEARRLVHRLAGAAGTFGFAELSRLAKLADDRLAAGEPVPDAEALCLIEALGMTLAEADRG